MARQSLDYQSFYGLFSFQWGSFKFGVVALRSFCQEVPLVMPLKLIGITFMHKP